MIRSNLSADKTLAEILSEGLTERQSSRVGSGQKYIQLNQAKAGDMILYIGSSAVATSATNAEIVCSVTNQTNYYTILYATADDVTVNTSANSSYLWATAYAPGTITP